MARQSVNLLPTYYQTDKNKKFLSSTLDQLIQTPNIERLNGFVGSKLSPNYNPSIDNYISDPQPLRNNYQLLPALVIKNNDGSPTKAFGYDDLINQLRFYGSDIGNLDRLFRPDFYSYDPKIDWDKFVNYDQYYWLPTGPQPVLITGIQREVTSTYTVVDSSDNNFFVFTPDGLTPDPLLTLYRGVTYVFNITSKYHLYIKTSQEPGPNDLYSVDIQNNGINKGQIIISVTENTPDLLYYDSNDGRVAGGQIVVKEAIENSFINVDNEIIGKANYRTYNGIQFINGMVVRFGGDVFPKSYANGTYIVEGVGESINLVIFSNLKTPENIASQYNDGFDDESFDEFPFDDFETLPLVPEYITINRASGDLNPWTRYNRWFHRNVIETAATANGSIFELPNNSVAARPIIEFKPNIKLFNFGTIGITPVDYIDTVTLDAFNAVEKSSGYWVDGQELQEGDRIIFNADTDPLTRGKIFRVHFVSIKDLSQDPYQSANLVISLIPTDDNDPVINSSVVVKKGTTYSGTSWHLIFQNGLNTWIKSQQHTVRNQAPYFDIVDSEGNSFSSYSSNFIGTKIFGYQIGTGIPDTVLGFALNYQSTELVSTYLFENYFMTDTVINIGPGSNNTIAISSGYLLENGKYKNVWTEAAEYKLAVQQFQVLYNQTTSINITVFDNPGFISDLTADIFVNNVKYLSTQFSIVASTTGTAVVNFTKPIPASTIGHRVLFNFYTNATPNSTGIYETPINLSNNPFNGPISQFTLSEVIDHVRTMVDRDPYFVGAFPGSSNLGILPNISQYGSRFISNKNSFSLAHYFISDQEHTLVNAIRLSGEDYNQFKLNFIKTISQYPLDSYTPSDAVDYVLTTTNENKNTSSPYLYSDMVPYGTDKKVRRHVVTDSRNTAYAITGVFDKTLLSNQAIIVYLNGNQLVYGADYIFDAVDPAVNIITPLIPYDVIVINEYLNTDGCYIAPTPTKLGIYPSFMPTLYSDNSYVNGPTNVIQCHDGSIIIAFNDYRDAIILELEKRIYNNLKTSYDTNLFDINSILPGAFRNNKYSYGEVYNLIQDLFVKWAVTNNVTYDKNLTYNISEHKTYNYKSAVDYILGGNFVGSWRAIYKYYFDTDRPDLCPWEMLGFSIKPDWWDGYYGPYPYTSGNAQLWADLEAGYVAKGPTQGFNTLYVRPGLSKVIPVDTSGNLYDIREWAGLAQNDNIPQPDQNWSFGDWGPAENAWRKSSNWPFAVQILLALAKPLDYANKLFDTSRMSLNNVGQYTFSGANEFIGPSIISIHSDIVNNQVVRAAGYGVYVVEIGKKRRNDYISYLKEQLTNGDFNLFLKVGGFVSQNKLLIIVDSYNLATQEPTPFLPNENYKVFFNTSNPVLSIGISGVIIIKSNGSYVIRGYDKKDLFFTIFNPIHQLTDTSLTVGGTAESYLTWTIGQSYQSGQVVFYQNSYYRVTINHFAGTTFNAKYYQQLSSLPIVDGISVIKASKFETKETVIKYGTTMKSIQEVYDFLNGYGHWLESQGFIFDKYNNDFNQTINWDFSASEFIYWTAQNWSNNSVITLSPFADTLKFQYQEGVVDNVLDSFYEYALYQADGNPFPSQNFNITRSSGVVEIKSGTVNQGIFFARLNLVQKEHALIFDNRTVFNDIIYDTESGYRQLRMKLTGFKTANWNGDFFSPGFIYDNAIISQWAPYANYMPADVVQYVGKYYSAINKITGTQTFDFSQWYLLPAAPTAQLLPNFDYKINQFEDFYSLDTNNFDASQQKMAQHLTGYSPRPYVDNIFADVTAQYKFYQGYIKEKGTLNSITKLEKASASNMLGTLAVNEEWAFRTGSYGSYSSYEEIELPLREADFVENNQVVQFVDFKPVNPFDVVSYVTPGDLLITPNNYQSNSTFIVSSGTYQINNFVYPTAGYVRLDDATYTFTTTNAILASTNIGNWNNGDIFWVGFDTIAGWDIFRYTHRPAYVSTARASGQDIIFTTNANHGLKVGELIAINNFYSTLNGGYVVTAVPLATEFTVSSNNFVPQNFKGEGLLFAFASVRFNNVDEIADFPYAAKIQSGEMFWVDDNGSGKWAVYRKTNNYASEIINPVHQPTAYFGYNVVKQASSSTVVVSAAHYYYSQEHYGRIYVFNADPKTGTLTRVYDYGLDTTDQRLITDQTPFGDTLFYDEVDDVIFAAASYATTSTTDAYRSSGIVKVSGIIRSGLGKEVTYANMFGHAQGERFGSGIYVQRVPTNKRVLIGAPGQSLSTTTLGVVYIYDMFISSNGYTYYNQTGSDVINSGIGASFDVTTVDEKYIVSLTTSTGTAYTVNSEIVIRGDILGGLYPDNNLNIKVRAVNENGSIVAISNTATNGISAYKSFTINPVSTLALPPPPVSILLGTTDLHIYLGVSLAFRAGSITVHSSNLNAYSTAVAGGLASGVGSYSYLEINGARYSKHNFGRGHTLAVIDPNTFAVTSIQTYDTYGVGSDILTTALTAIPPGSLIAIGTWDATSLNSGTRSYLQSHFGATDTVTWGSSRVSHIFIGVKNGVTPPYEQHTANTDLTGNIVYTENVGLGKLTNNNIVKFSAGSEFGYAIVGNQDGSIIAISSPGINNGTGAAFVYTYSTVTNTYSYLQQVPSMLPLVPGNRFGTKMVMNDLGTHLVVATSMIADGRTEVGKIVVYEWTGTQFTYIQTIDNPAASPINFGTSLSITPAGETLAVTGQGSPYFNDITFDGGKTTFDNLSCLFGESVTQSGSAYIYQRYNKKFIFAQELINGSIDPGGNYGFSVALDNNFAYVGNPDISSGKSGLLYLWNKIDRSNIGLGQYRIQDDTVDLSLVDNAYTLDTLKETVLDYLDIVDPVKDRLPGLADQELTYKTPFDPSIYSIGDQNVVVDPTKSWGKEHIGELWWDISVVKYVWYEQGEISYRKNVWGKIFPGSSIDIYEWVESTYPPSKWAALSDTPTGLTLNISGQPKNLDDSVYSSREIFDKSTGQFTTLYYYWVKNKLIIPSNSGRRLSAYDVASLIKDPRGYGLKYISLISADALSVNNYKTRLISNRIDLNVAYNAIKTKVNKHTEWILLQEGDENSQPTPALNRKMFDSLLGHDVLGNLVPDPSLSFRQSYGIQIRPRQSMFTNRIEALRNLISYANLTMQTIRITGFVSFKNLNLKDEIPNILLGEYDQVVEDSIALDIVVTTNFKTATLSAEVLNGRLIKIKVTDPGSGYLIPPTVAIGDGTGPASIQTILDDRGRVIDALIINAGSNFVNAPILIVRPYTIILKVDPIYNNRWSKYIWTGMNWLRSYTQTYDTTQYWKYVDWKDTTYNLYKSISYAVDSVYEAQELSLNVGDYIKVQNAGDGNYIILRKTDGTVGTFDDSFDIVYSQNGTIQILDDAWNVSTSDFGFDEITPFDQSLYDQTPDTELLNILTALHQDVFSGVNRIYWNKFFFTAVKYAFIEQPFLDWAFKTSFIDVKNLAGVLDQRATYRYQDPTWYNDYINEIKPYHTQIRNYQVNYQIGESNEAPWEPTSTYTTDFDLPSYYDNSTGKFTVVTTASSLITQYPYAGWYNNYSFSISNIIIENSGFGYRLVPKVDIIPAPGDTGAGATAQAYIANGSISKILVTNPGRGYTIQPAVMISGGGNTALTTATAYAQLENNLIRTNFVKIKFDRVSINTGTNRDIGISNIVTATIITNGSHNSFNLPWAASPLKLDTVVTLDNILVLKSNFTVTNYIKIFTTGSNLTSYTKQYSNIDLNFVPKKGQVLVATFKKNIGIYNASERIQDYYNPTVTMPGKQLPQLMLGAEYPGTTVEGLPFEYDQGFGDMRFGSSGWGDVVPDIYYYIITTSTRTQVFTVPSVSAGTLLNVYVESWGPLNNNTTTNILLDSTRVDGTSTYGVIVNTGTGGPIVVDITSNAFTSTSVYSKVVFRTPEQNAAILSTNIDTLIDGGTLSTFSNNAFNTALGYRPSDIIVDGDTFVTPYTSYGPEELLSGQVQDTLAINVFTEVSSGSPLILTQNAYVTATGVTTAVQLKLLPVSTGSIMVSFNQKYLAYGIDYTVDYSFNRLILNAQSQTGVLGITVIEVGGIDLLSSYSQITFATDTATISSRNPFKNIGSIYVTVNGVTVVENGTGLGYTFTANKKNIGVINLYGMGIGVHAIQCWFFKPTYKAYSEVKEQLIAVTDTTSTFNLIQVPGNQGPYEAQAIVTVNGLRLPPPHTTYYEVTADQTAFVIHPLESYPPGIFSLATMKVFRNGVQLNNVTDFELIRETNTIEFGKGSLNGGDVLAIETFNNAAYKINETTGILTLSTPVNSGDLVGITTFTNGDASQIRTEQFDSNLSNQYTMSRTVLDDSYVWVSVDGKPLVANIDYAVLNDHLTVEISNNYSYGLGSIVLITSISTQIINTSIGYRQFKDILGRTQFKRISESNSTVLARDLLLTDTEIYVKDASVLTIPNPTANFPGVIFINSERIEYMAMNGNILSVIKRATLGTGANIDYTAGTILVDAGVSQSIPDRSMTFIQNFITTNTTTYTISTATIVQTGTVYAKSVGDGITLNANISGKDQIEVWYAGRQLSKTEQISHDNNVGFDSGENNSDSVIPEEFSVDLISQTLTLTPVGGLKQGMRVTIIQRKDGVWQYPGQSLLDGTTAQSNFLLQRQSGIPDKYQYESN
jgi:hypothetical protein